MNKKIISLIVAIIGIGLIGYAAFGMRTPSMSDGQRFKETYEALNTDSDIQLSLSADNPIKFIDVNQAYDIVTNGTGVIYFGFPQCPWCRTAVPVMFDAAQTTGLQTLYYFNPRDYRDGDNETFAKLMEVLTPHLTTDDDNNPRIFVPDVFFVKDGQILSNHLGTIDSALYPLEPGVYQQLKDIYVAGMRQVMGN